MLSGTVTGWGDELVSYFDLVVFVTTPRELRLERLRAREAAHFGADAVAAGGWRHDETEAFVEWTSHYEAGDREGRNLAKHEAWLAGLLLPGRARRRRAAGCGARRTAMRRRGATARLM